MSGAAGSVLIRTINEFAAFPAEFTVKITAYLRDPTVSGFEQRGDPSGALKKLEVGEILTKQSESYANGSICAVFPFKAPESRTLAKGNIMTAISATFWESMTLKSIFQFRKIELGYPFVTRVRFDTGEGGNNGAAPTSKVNAATSVVTCRKNETEAD